MLRGYLLALCSGSSLDESVKNFSLFNLVENLAVPTEALGQAVPIELHFHFFVAPEARNADFELRLMRVEQGGVVDAGGALKFRTGDGPRFRLKAAAFRLPMAFGDYRLHVEWRREGEEAWHADHQEWPLSLKQLPSASDRSPPVTGPAAGAP